MPFQCFWLEPTGRLKVHLRRYASGTKCDVAGNQGYHQALVRIEDRPAHYTAEGYLASEEPAPNETRWATHCACGYEFKPEDNWQVFIEEYYRRSDNREETTLRDAPPGAMWDAFWMKSYRGQLPIPEDGLYLMVRVPGEHEWYVDGPASNGPGWTRTGTVPNITARPSIGSPNYHGWLTDGVLSDDLEGRKYA